MFLPSKDVPPTPRQRNARPGTATPVTARRYPLLLTALVVGVALAVIPVLLAFQLAREQAVKEKFRQLDAFASGFALQVRDARQMLDLLVDEGRHSTAPACDADDIRRLQRFDLGARAVQSTLRIDKGRIVCSAAGDLMKHVRLGPAAMIRGDGTRVHINVQIPGIPKLRYTVLERDGYGLLVFPDALMAPFIQDDITLATFSVATGQVSSSSGPVQTGWTRGMDANKTVERFVDRKAQFMVVRTRVTHDGTGVLVATPLSTVNSRIDQFSRWFIPLGALLGLGVLALAFRITRRQFSPRAELLQALRRQQFFLLYQPVFDLQNNTCIGAEALLRWRQPDGSIRAPDLFIPFAEDNGLVPLLTERVLELVQQDMAAFLRQHRRFRLAINLSPHDLQSAQTLQLLARLIADTGPGCGQFMVEITERGLLQESRAVDAINAIRDLGVKVAIDDFGTGYSSLSYLTTYRFDVLKIDKAFTGTACTDAVTNHVALHIIELGRSLGLETLAEGIETGEQAELFRAKGVACAQGYHFARPMPAAELLAFYRQHAGDGDDGGSNGD